MDNLIIDFDIINENTYYIEENLNVDRIFIKNAKLGNVVHIKPGLSINTIRGVLIQDCRELNIYSEDTYCNPNITGGIQVAGSIDRFEIDCINVLKGEHGLLMSQHTGKEIYGSIALRNCMFLGNGKEGIYIGKYNGMAPIIDRVEIINCHVINNGWDGVQVGAVFKAKISNTIMVNNGTQKEDWQDFDLTINPKCVRVDIIKCNYNTAQFLGAPKVFIRP